MSPRSKSPTDVDYRATLSSQREGKGFFVCFFRINCPISCHCGCNPESLFTAAKANAATGMQEHYSGNSCPKGDSTK